MHYLKLLTTHPYINILLGIILCVTALYEIFYSLEETSEALKIGTQHGVFVLGLFHILKTLPDIAEGLERISK